MNEIKFSCIVPVYNSAVYLHECINSLICQSYTNIEILLINDGSTDDSALICDEYAFRDKRIKVFHKRNEGAGEARNIGIKYATGDYLVFLDSDDFLTLEAIERFSNTLNIHKDIDIIASDYLVYNENFEYFMKFTTIIDNKPLNGCEFLKLQLKNHSFLTGTCHHIVKRTFLTTNNLYFYKEYVAGEDEHWAPRIYLKATSVITSNYAHYYQRKGHISRSNPANPIELSISMLSICYDLEIIYRNIADVELKLLLSDYLVHLYLSQCIYRSGFYHKKYKDLIDEEFINQKVYFWGTRLKVFVYKISPVLYVKIYAVYEYLWKRSKSFKKKFGK